MYMDGYLTAIRSVDIWAIMTVWRTRGKIIRTVLCCITSWNCAQWYAHNWLLIYV